MPPNKPRLLLLLLIVVAALQGRAQTCTGSLGDPVINQDFGSGAGPGAALAGGVTTYRYTTSTCPDDGQYTIASATSACFGSTWHTIIQDHTGNANGYMMIINASEGAGKFFEQKTTIGALCQNTTYEFSAYILNLIVPSACGGASRQPNITFSIETPDGLSLNPGPEASTGDVPPTTENNKWIQKKVYFTTPPGVSEVIIKMINNSPGGCGNDLLLDDITFRACGPIVQAGFAGAASVTQQNTCVGQPAIYNIAATPGTGYYFPQYQWQQNLNDGKGWIDVLNEKTTSHSVIFNKAELGTYQYRLGVAEGANINSLNCRVYSNPVTLTVTSFPVVPTILPVSVCEGEPLTLSASGGATYTWTGPNLRANSQNPLVIPNASLADAGNYKVTVTSAEGCETMKTTEVTVTPKPVVAVSATQNICKGSNTTLTAFSPGLVSYQWMPVTGLSDATAANPIAGPDQTTVYTVTVTDVNRCSGTADVEVKVSDVPVADAGPNRKMSEGQSIKLENNSSGDILSYSWSPADRLDNPDSATPIASPTEDITYTLTVTSANDCGTDTSSVFVRVYKKVTVPNTFSPNSDGANDFWNIEALDTYAKSSINIYNRSGQLVYNNIGYSKAWDGNLKGKPLPAGTYYYVIDLKNDSPPLSGWVMLVR